MDTSYGASILGGRDGFTHLPVGQDTTGEPMDLDVDIDDMCWAGDFAQTLYSANPDSSFNVAYCPPVPTLPYDLLFAEDEGYLPVVSYNPQPASFGDMSFGQPKDIVPRNPSPRSLDDGSHDLAHERLRKQLSLLSKGWCGDEIKFKNCDPAKSHILHNLAIELGLEYKHNVRSREVSICRLEPSHSTSGQQHLPGRLSSSIPRSSTELDSTLCLPGAPVFSVLTIHESELEAAEAAPATNEARREQLPVPPIAKQQSLVRSPSRSERISDSIREHVSTLRASVAKGGRRPSD